tara:strand:+ start:384 stop:650 length:267 start_codon:yes stop_codon:yes gene_type:complete
MNKKFLHKVLNQLVRETRIDYEKERVYTPFPFLSSILSLPFLTLPHPTIIPSSFFYHCRDVYGLNDEESEYVWGEYRNIIKDKINSNE